MSVRPDASMPPGSRVGEAHPIAGTKASPIALAFARSVQGVTDARALSRAIAAILSRIDAALSSLIGSRGVAALYGRSVHLTAREHAWLANALDAGAPMLELARLETEIGRQEPAEALAAGQALLNEFDVLLASLIGPSLSERLLRPVWEDIAGEPPAQETAP